MLEILAATAIIVATSLLLGGGVLALVNRPASGWLAGATGFAALVVVAALTIRLPGRAATTAAVVGVLAAVAALVLWRRRPRLDSASLATGGAVVAILLVLGTLPFVLNDRLGVLGEGIYTNDHAAQLYWADWLQNGFGPEPSAVQFGYPIGPQAVAALVAEVTGINLVAAFNGLMLAICALTGLTALAALGGVGVMRRIAIASIAGLPYLAASFLAQTAFKETAMALFVLAFALVLAGFSGLRWRGTIVLGLLLAAASVVTFSIPGLAWFAAGFAVWFVAETIAGSEPVDWRAVRAAVDRHRVAVGAAALVLVAAVALAAGPAINFVEKINEVQDSRGRLSSPVPWGEVFGVWPVGDFRIVRGEVPGSLVAIAIGGLAAAFGFVTLVRRRRWALASMLVAGGAIYVGARLFAEIHVEAKALAIVAPLVLLVSLLALLEPDDRSPLATRHSGDFQSSGERRVASGVRYAAGTALLTCALLSTLLALRAAPVGPDDHGRGLERLADEIEGESVIFLGVDRFAGYRLRGTLMRAPAGYVPEEIAARDDKPWQQGHPADFDTVEPSKLDKFDYAITTTAGYQSAAPDNFEPVLEAGDYVLWERNGETPRSRILAERDQPGLAAPPCVGREGGGSSGAQPPGGRPGVASEFATTPVVVQDNAYRRPPRVERAAGDQEDAFLAPDTARAELDIPRTGAYELSLQYHSEVPIEVAVDGEVVDELDPSLEGMYLAGAGHGAFWPAGEFEAEAGRVEVELRAAEPTGLQDALGVPRRVWIGTLAATSQDDPREASFAALCGRYVDHYRLDRGGNRADG